MTDQQLFEADVAPSEPEEPPKKLFWVQVERTFAMDFYLYSDDQQSAEAEVDELVQFELDIKQFDLSDDDVTVAELTSTVPPPSSTYLAADGKWKRTPPAPQNGKNVRPNDSC